MLIKLGLSRKFLRVASCTRKSVLGVGIMKPLMILGVLKINNILEIKEREETLEIQLRHKKNIKK